MRYRQILPPPYLTKHVRYFWTLEGNDAENKTDVFRPLPDGCPGLIFQPGFAQQDYTLPDFFLYGQTTQQNEIVLREKVDTIGVYFYPDALRSVFGLNAETLTNICMNAADISPKKYISINDQLLNTATVEEKINIISVYLFDLIQKNSRLQNTEAQYIFSAITKSYGNISLKSLHADTRLSERSFERKFKQHVGISAKLFSRICRFQTSLKQLRNNNFQKLSDIAYENEYADQSHFIRAFKEFAGCTPQQFQKQTNEIVENFPIITSPQPSPKERGQTPS
jgi:AraC-like DNA-binding protein